MLCSSCLTYRVRESDLTEQESGADGKLEIPIAGTLQKLYLYFSRQADGL